MARPRSATRRWSTRGPRPSDAATAAAAAGDGPERVLEAAADAAVTGAESTDPLVARKGRASYLGERAIGHRDPGAQSDGVHPARSGGRRVTVGILSFSHSAAIATGTVELARQMAADVPMVGRRRHGRRRDRDVLRGDRRRHPGARAGGRRRRALRPRLRLPDPPTTALDFLDEADRDRVARLAGPLVEGTVAAAVAAQDGGDVDARPGPLRHRPARSADDDERRLRPDGGRPRRHGTRRRRGSERRGGHRDVELVNESGLHARPRPSS